MFDDDGHTAEFYIRCRACLGAENLYRHRAVDIHGVLRQLDRFVAPRVGVVTEFNRHKVGVTADKTMFVNIQSADFFLRRNAQSDGLFNQGKDQEHRNARPCCDGDHAEALHAEKFEAAAV
ncbi:hypothetical protein SDC9_140513 [bioreactor metagenome]|uniref:Uncharacterized protein n=1 Tax=bioreactor metagenome TaxID=1076179 RepID=A0A645DVL2_9ZZZZ